MFQISHYEKATTGRIQNFYFFEPRIAFMLHERFDLDFVPKRKMFRLNYKGEGLYIYIGELTNLLVEFIEENYSLFRESEELPLEFLINKIYSKRPLKRTSLRYYLKVERTRTIIKEQIQ